ncbi:MAG: type II toxin-antitoxin system prevent-host-death family antitoxin [Gammaproteobacteria bacterium]|nr:type II toxin-antitoxin system prevent-host-death family antitoxin [Gammaproteobacteria bacterium]
MKQIWIRDLHIKIGEWVRKAARGEGVIITERGRPVASLIPFDEDNLNRSFHDRQLLPEFDALPEVSGDAAMYISEDRNRS